MSKKRKAEEEVAADFGPSKQQRRERTTVDLELVDLYHRLADQKESRRLKAASKLLKKLHSDSSSSEQIYTALRRLFRGLCSSRKAARQGFAVALTELLAQLASQQIDTPLASEFLVSIWEDSTAPDGGATKQEERDHFLGRVFGADTILRSGILTSRQDREQWKRLLSLLCTISQKKPWLRQECGWLLYQFVAMSSEPTLQPFAEDIIDSLSSHKLIRTPEGVAVWLAAKKSYPKAKMAKHVWKHGHPLVSKDLKILSDIMKDAKLKSLEDDSEAQGAATWSANLHFAWNVVLSYFFESDSPMHGSKKAAQSKSVEDVASFQEFWHVVVDEGLFGANSSPERKQWGVLVWTMALQRAPPLLLPELFTTNAMHCLVTALGTRDSYRRKTYEVALKSFESRIKELSQEQENYWMNASCVKAIITATDYSDFDTLTKTKLTSTILTVGSLSALNNTAQMLGNLFEEAADNTKRQKYMVELQSKVLTSLIRDVGGEPASNANQTVQDLLIGWLDLIFTTGEIEPGLLNLVKGRLEGCLEQFLRSGTCGRSIIRSCVKSGIVEKIEKGSIKCDKRIQKMVMAAWRRIEELDQNVQTDETAHISVHDGLSLLYCVFVMEVVGGEANAIEGLQELSCIDLARKGGESSDAMNALVELLLALAPRPSKFLRLASHQIFESIAPYITEEGLESLMRVMTTSENDQGQQEMLEDAGDEDLDIEKLDQSDFDEDDLGSDVEITDVSEEDSSTDSMSNPDSVSSSAEDTSEDENDESVQENERNEEEELAAFDAALASALGTRRLEHGDEDVKSSDSGSDMDDEQMMALDEKLIDVFKARKDASNKKKERKDTREVFIGFKNRVLDLVELYLKHEAQSRLSVGLILPLLQSVRITKTKQLADRTCNILRQFFAKCKGQNVPKIRKDQAPATLTLLKRVHEEACLESSNAHSAASSSASIFLVKVLLSVQINIGQMIDIYGDTRKRQMTDKSSKVQPGFFNDWNNWCSQARTQLTK